jgi:tetratricopeptide (TPR) repeat protein
MARLICPCIVAATLVAGCASQTHFAEQLPSMELADVPFFAQTAYQCGPAALATILANEHVPVDAQALSPAVYVSGLHGTLQAELLAATRRYGLIPYVLTDERALFTELRAGRPVLVLQNLGLKKIPVYHYAVIVGFDAERERVILRSGTQRRRAERIRKFLHTWTLAGNWAFVAVRPGALPATAAPEPYVRAVADAEPTLGAAAARKAYETAYAHWPNDDLVVFAAANRNFADGRFADAEQGYRRLIDRQPDSAPARNNLANVLLAQGRVSEALQQARAAQALVSEQAGLRPAIEDTLAEIRAAAANGAEELNVSYRPSNLE